MNVNSWVIVACTLIFIGSLVGHAIILKKIRKAGDELIAELSEFKESYGNVTAIFKKIEAGMGWK